MNKVNSKGVAGYAPTILTAIIALAIAFTFNACGDDSSEDPTPPAVSSSGGGISSSDGNGTSSGTETSSSSEQAHSYASCDKADEELNKCIEAKWPSEEAMYIAAVGFRLTCFSELGFTSGSELTDAQEAKLENCISDKMEGEITPCIEESGICGGASMEDCLKHFEETCDE
jgi:hypothetical protein